jgi:hypothetical protein
MLVAKISPAAQKIIQKTPFEQEVLTGEYMIVQCNKYVIGSIVGTFTDENYFELDLRDLEIIQSGHSKSRPIPLTDEWILRFQEFNETDKEGTPCFFNGDNIMLFDRGSYFDAYLHSEYNGNVFFATRLFYVHQLQNFHHAIEKQDLTIRL